MRSGDNEIGVIILGNSGVGKSFLGNVIVGKEVFQHDYRVDAVTLKTEYLESYLDGHLYSIYNIPGLIESDQERIDSNILEIDLAFQQHPNAVVLFVFGTNNGKIRNEDVVAFNSINAAYPLSQKSLILVINSVSPDRPNNYEYDVETKIEGLLKINRPRLCFVDQIKRECDRLTIRKKLVPLILAALPKVHSKVQNISVKAAEISKLTKIVDQLQKHLDEEREKRKQDEMKHESAITEMKNKMSEMTINQERSQREANQLQEALQQQQQRSQRETSQLQEALLQQQQQRSQHEMSQMQQFMQQQWQMQQRFGEQLLSHRNTQQREPQPEPKIIVVRESSSRSHRSSSSHGQSSHRSSSSREHRSSKHKSSRDPRKSSKK